MIFQPVLNPLLLLLLMVPMALLTILLLVRSKTRGAKVLWGVRTLLVLLCFVLLLRPGIPGGTTQTLSTDTDIVLMVDTTASTVAEDWDGSQPRLDGMRADVAKIIEHYPGARFALITFDATPELRLPLTTDTSAVTSAMDVLRPEVTANSRGSSIGIAASLLQQTLKSAAEAKGERARMVFYLGDGEQTVSSSPESFASSQKYVDGGTVLGYGTTPGGPMKITDGSTNASDPGYIQYQGQNAMSVIDEGNLKKIADELQVPYEHREAQDDITLPEAPTTSTDFSADGTAGHVQDVYPVIAFAIIGLLGFELARAALLITRLRGLQVRAETAATAEPKPKPKRARERGES